MTRRESWKKYDEQVAQDRNQKLPPAFIQEITVGGLWCVQVLCDRNENFGWLHRLLNDPPKHASERFYNGWPGDHRGWMRFQTKEEARDFYRFCTKKISYDEFRSLDRVDISAVRIDLDDDGNFIEGPSIVSPEYPH